MTFSWTTLFASLSAISATILGLMTQVLGCHMTGGLSAICDGAPWLPAAWAGYAAIAFGLLSLVTAGKAPGGTVANLFGQKAAVLPENHPLSGVGTTTPQEVARP